MAKRWWKIRKAGIEADIRELFEESGEDIVRETLMTSGRPLYSKKGNQATAAHMRPWLTEQYDEAKRRETASFFMEIMIVVLVAAELTMSLINFVFGKR